MDFEYFDKLWGQGDADLAQQRNHWDIRAEEFNNYRAQTANERIQQLIDFLACKGMTLENMDILDIGCGAGQFALAFAKKAKNVVGVDISPKMIEFAKQNAIDNGVSNVQFHVFPWEEIDVAQYGWNKRFDLAVANMTPAITSRVSLEKMMAISKGYCFMSRYLERYEEVLEKIKQNVLKRNYERSDYGRDIYCSFNVLWLYGIHPEIKYLYMDRENDRSPEEAYTYYSSQLDMEGSLTDLQKQALKDYLLKIAQHGRVKDNFKSKVAWLFWKN